MSDILTIAEIGKLKRTAVVDTCYNTLMQAINDASVDWALNVADDRGVTGQVFGRITGDTTVDWGSLGTFNDIAASSTAMDAVAASSTACTAIAASATAITALDNSSPILVPQMTSNTAPSGVVSAGIAHASFPAWYAFDKNTSTWWSAGSAGAGESVWWLEYAFTSAVWCYKFDVNNYTAEVGYVPKDVRVQYYDGSAWQDATSTITLETTALTRTHVVCAPSGKVTRWRLKIDNTVSGTNWPALYELQFYCK